jgi:hypothetical protein
VILQFSAQARLGDDAEDVQGTRRGCDVITPFGSPVPEV